jgi:GT2 family glycosyltransferase
VPRTAYRLAGGIDGAFTHAYADMDYSLRLCRAGGENMLIAGHVGTCIRNDSASVGLDPSLPFFARWRFFHSRKGNPLASQVHYLRRHGGPCWPIFLLPPYVRLLAGLPFPHINHDTMIRRTAELRS